MPDPIVYYSYTSLMDICPVIIWSKLARNLANLTDTSLYWRKGWPRWLPTTLSLELEFEAFAIVCTCWKLFTLD